MTTYGWLKDQSKHDEIIEWLGGRWDIDQLQAWCKDRFTLDELKEWLDGKYTIDEVVTWRYHKSDPVAEMVITVVEGSRPTIEKDKGTLAFLGIDSSDYAHIALDGACGSCLSREEGTLKTMSDIIDAKIPEVRGLINDGPRRAILGDFSIQDFSAAKESPVRIISRSRGLTPPTSNS